MGTYFSSCWQTPIGSCWVYNVKHHPDGFVERLKAHLVAKGYTQTYGVDYSETISPVARFNSVRVLIYVAVSCDWPLYQLDIKNAFLQGDLQEEVFLLWLYGLKQSPRAWFDKFSSVVLQFGFKCSSSDHSVFAHQSSSRIIVLIVHVDDIIISGSDSTGIASLKQHLSKEFHTKDLGFLRYFLKCQFQIINLGYQLMSTKVCPRFIISDWHSRCTSCGNTYGLICEVGC